MHDLTTAASGPAIGFGPIRHVRLRPARHEFTYSGYFLRLPLRALTQRPSPARLLRFNRAGLFAVNDRDHGDGGPLLTWIESLLAQAGVRDADGEIWLHTFPRVLGYVFNPVSFWFAHRANGELRAVVCEVNNTFGERHCYLLAHDDGCALRDGESLQASKVFHVSPFCEVAGSYRFRFLLSCAGRAGAERSAARWIGCVNYEDDEGLLLKTSIAGELVALDDRALVRALFAYPAFTFGVIARIHWQALRLWLKRVPFVSKPAPPALQVTR